MPPKRSRIKSSNQYNVPPQAPTLERDISSRHHQGDFSKFFFGGLLTDLPADLALSLANKYCCLVSHKELTTDKSMSSRPTTIRSSISNPENLSLVRSSASSFSSLGRHLKIRDSLDREIANDNCMLIAISGHFVVDLFKLKASLDRLSIPAARDIGIDFLSLDGTSQPNACSATRVASSSADADAHMAPLPSLNINGTSLSRSLRENQRLVFSSQPPKIMYSSVHLASVRKDSSS